MYIKHIDQCCLYLYMCITSDRCHWLHLLWRSEFGRNCRTWVNLKVRTKWFERWKKQFVDDKMACRDRIPLEFQNTVSAPVFVTIVDGSYLLQTWCCMQNSREHSEGWFCCKNVEFIISCLTLLHRIILKNKGERKLLEKIAFCKGWSNSCSYA